MENTTDSLQNSSNYLNLFYNLPFITNYNLQYFFTNPPFEKTNQDNKKVGSSRILTETNFNEEYQSQPKRNIILCSKTSQIYKKLKISQINESDQQTKVCRKPSQKETRNINSNLMRIFLKNLIELKVYNNKINLLSTRLGGDFTAEDFYHWIQMFSINFKNYIRASQVSKIIGDQQPLYFRKIFMRLLKDYSQQIGLQHCLTSKRIEQSSVKMHLGGLRCLNRDLLKASYTKN